MTARALGTWPNEFKCAERGWRSAGFLATDGHQPSLKTTARHADERRLEMLEIDEKHPDRLPHRNTTERIIGAAFEARRELGYGFLERVYERALQVELIRRGSTAEIEKRVPVQDKDVVVGDYDSDLVVDGCVLVERKVNSSSDRRDEAQLLNVLKATGRKIGLLVNFGRTKVEYKRLVF